MIFKVNEIKISYREHTRISQTPQLSSSRDVAALLHQNWDADTLALKESFERNKSVLSVVNNNVSSISKLMAYSFEITRLSHFPL